MNPPSFASAARAFQGFFSELRALYLEREALFTQIELALLCREHVLIVGPPGTAKSAIAADVLGRIVDEATGAPSLFAKQLSESTVQTDLVGPVDFKVLTETGRTEYLLDEGMLGARHAFLDEVFDGRDMLLRSILNVLHERELKGGRRIAAGRTQSVLMTSNRYLSEVLARSPELLLAFADRLAFVSFVPRAFVRPESRAAMLRRFAAHRQPVLHGALSLQQLSRLQDEVDAVQVPAPMLEALELLADALERLLTARAAKLPDALPTKYFSQRSLVKALWVLKAAVVRDCAVRDAERERVVGPEDLEALRAFFLLGGPSPDDVEALLRGPVDARERAQLERVQLEHRAFDEALAQVRAQLGEGPSREARALHPEAEAEAAGALARGFEAARAHALASALRTKLVPGPRHAENRAPLLAAARTLLSCVTEHLPQEPQLHAASAAVEVLGLAQEVPELAAPSALLEEALARALAQALAGVVDGAEATAFEAGLTLERLAQRASEVQRQLDSLRGLLRPLPAPARTRLEAGLADARARAAAALARCAQGAFEAGAPAETPASLSREAGHLAAVEAALAALQPAQRGLAQRLLAPLAAGWTRRSLAALAFQDVRELTQGLQAVGESLRRLGLPPEPLLAGAADVLEPRLLAQAGSWAGRTPPVPPAPEAALDGRAHALYHQGFAGPRAGAGLAALSGLALHLPVSDAVRRRFVEALRGELEGRLDFLAAWLAALQAERDFDRWVHSRLPLLLLREGELARLGAEAQLLASVAPEAARSALARLEALQTDFKCAAEALLAGPSDA